MGWAGQLTVPDSAQKGWADLGPTVLSTSFDLGWTRPRHQGRATTGLTQNIKTGGYYPSPILLHRRRLSWKWSKSGGERRVTWHRGGGALLVWLLRWRCCSEGRWQCHCLRTTAPSSGETRLFTLLGVSFCFLFFCCQTSSLFYTPCFFFLNSLPYFKLPCVLYFLSLSHLLLLLHLFPFFIFLLHYASLESNIYRAKGSGGVLIAALSLRMGSGAFLPCGAGRGDQRAPLAWHGLWVSHYEGALGFGCLAEHAGRERERQEELKKKKQKLYLPLLHVQGKKKGE